MRTERKRRLYFILIVLVGVFSAIGFALFALRHNIDLYYTPTQLLQAHSNQPVRIGGLGVKGSVHHQQKKWRISFVLTDFHHKVVVKYHGVLPSLFREGQGIVARGYLNQQGIFIADQVLAKHDENYHPPNIPKGTS